MRKSDHPFFLGYGNKLWAHPWIRLLFEVVGSLVTLFVFFCLILCARLSFGPLNIDMFIPRIEAALAISDPNLKLSVEHLQLAWREWNHPFELEMINVRIQKGQNSDWMTIEDVGLSLYLHSLLRGDVVLKQVRIYRPFIRLERETGGQFSLGFEEALLDQDLVFEDIAPFLTLNKAPPYLARFNALKSIAIVEAQVVLRDVPTGKTWELPQLTLVLNRYATGAKALFTLPFFKGKGGFSLGVLYESLQDRLDVTADLNQIAFHTFLTGERPPLPFDAFLVFLEQWEVPLHGQAFLSFSPTTFEIITGTANLALGKGQRKNIFSLKTSPSEKAPFLLDSGHLSFSFSPQRILLKNLSLKSGQMRMGCGGQLSSSEAPFTLNTLLEKGQTFELSGKISGLPLDHLSALWPEDMAQHAREWMTKNLKKGTLTRSLFALKGQVEEPGIQVKELQGTLLAQGAELTYLKGLPPIQHLDATAKFDQKGFEIEVLSGKIKNLKLEEGRILITGLDTGTEALNLGVKMTGPFRDILEVIDHEPLKYASDGGIDPKTAGGNSALDLQMDFPLLEDLRFKDIKMKLVGSLKEVGLQRKISKDFTASLRNASLELNLNQNQMHIKGRGMLNKLSSSLSYFHNFKASAPYKMQFKVNTTASFADFRRFGFDYETYGSGPTGTQLIYTYKKGGKGSLEVSLDTTLSQLSFPPLNWKKPRGKQGILSFLLEFEQGHLVKMDELRFSASPYSLKGSIFFGPGDTWKKILLSQFKGPHTETSVTIQAPAKNVYAIDFKGHSLDVEKINEYADNNKSVTDRPFTEIKLSAVLDQLRLGEGKIFNNVKVNADLLLEGRETHWNAVNLTANAGQGATNSGGIFFNIVPGSNQTQRLTARANDAGQLLKNLDLYDNVQGGNISIQAVRQNYGPYKGIYTLSNFDALKVPLLARFAGVLSPVGIVNLFSDNEAISLEEFSGAFTFDEKMVSLQKGIGKSMALGFTVEGRMDREKKMFDLNGTLIPAHFLNALLSNVPVVGTLLSGGKGEGIFGMSYTVTGPFSNPSVSVNPLSVFAPGFLRQLFVPKGESDESFGKTDS